jgi:hypothetical protein
MKIPRAFGLEPMLRATAFYPRSWNDKHFDTGEVGFDMIFGETAEARTLGRALSARASRRFARGIGRVSLRLQICASRLQICASSVS